MPAKGFHGATLSTQEVPLIQPDGKLHVDVIAAHLHVINDTVSLQTELNDRAPISHTHAAADIASGTVATARLGSGTADATTFLRGDQTYAAPPAGGSGSYELFLDFGTREVSFT